MEGDYYVLQHKSELLFVSLSTKGRGRKCWEYTEDIHHATKFSGAEDTDKRTAEHKCPQVGKALRPYENAHADWLNTPRPL